MLAEGVDGGSSAVLAVLGLDLECRLVDLIKLTADVLHSNKFGGV